MFIIIIITNIIFTIIIIISIIIVIINIIIIIIIIIVMHVLCMYMCPVVWVWAPAFGGIARGLLEKTRAYLTQDEDEG